MGARPADRPSPETPEPSPCAGEEQLLRSAQQGDREAFARLVERYWTRLYRWLYHLTHNRHMAEDLAQEAFLKALANLDRFRPGTNFRAWLFRIAHNVFANLQRSPSRRRETLPDFLPAREPGPFDQACNQETLLSLSKALDLLPTDYRAALLLRAEEGLSFRQIAGILKTTEETARWRVFKARQRLLETIESTEESVAEIPPGTQP